METTSKQKVGLPYRDSKMELIPDTDCEIVHEDGKWYVIRKKEKYPKTYVECCKVLGCKPIFGFSGLDDDEENLYGRFIALIRCRDAYWKIAGDWKPDWKNGELYFMYYLASGKGVLRESTHFGLKSKIILIFPSKEMCDAFYENYKGLIDQCKEFL